MPAIRWKSFATTDPEREYLVLASYLPLRRFSATFRFVRRTVAVRRQLASAQGLVGYSMLAKPLSRQYLTLSVWEDEAALAKFVSDNPHVEIMSALAPDMRPTRFARWHVAGSSLPPRWPEALHRIEDAAASS
jgi:hypothetical protein